MLFRSISLRGWQQFGAVDIEFHNRLTVLTGANGSGKTTLLRFLARRRFPPPSLDVQVWRGLGADGRRVPDALRRGVARGRRSGFDPAIHEGDAGGGYVFPSTSRRNRGWPRRAAKVGSIASQPGDR